MGNFVYDVPRVSLSRSPPDSLRGDPETPRTPDDAGGFFGEPVATSGAHVSSASAAGATAVLSTFTHLPAGPLSPVNEMGTAASGSSQVRGREIPRFVGGFSSQIWAPTRLDQGTASAAAAAAADNQAASAAHARWGSLDAHMNQRDGFVRRENPIARPSPFAAYQTRFPAAVNTPPNVYRPANPQGFARPSSGYPMFAQQHSAARYNHEAGVTAMNRQMSAASSMNDSLFDLSELQSSLFSSAGVEAAVNQPLGIDILRLSTPGVAPIRQLSSAARPAARPAQVPVNAPTGGFLPMQAVMQQTPSQAFTADFSPCAPSTAKFSSRYHGMHTETNASAEHLAPEQNCALWLTNLPAGTSTHQLLKAIRNVGRVWCTYVNYPDFHAHSTAAAKVVFFTPEAAQQLLSISWTRGLFVEGQRVKVSYNRIKYGSHPVAGRMSRVLIITGHADFVNEAALTKFFKDRFIFQLDEVTELIRAGGRAVMEFKFGSYRCQSQMGKMSLEKDRPRGLEKVEFGDDPCEVGDTMSSYGIAADRIQGRGF
ncbi:hypothetical protein TRIATDRAFT_49252 [Trichoderma atroviride IMI 206040]|uniref:RRM domain-containing protein n=1 Tax=Hypocrea atroviridis (strain ATCC 20476 / IMI 206040) TaxID=452589 RepID=G9NK68_HYPAI|nr:uncharacterized protein TRIATDRAFT_49252 [Trichoderma atroviride IMI 206040]EHK49287.1 hypothetical protein TRIATDRAFT_49252 [Trichoderma atroviride IMI 206040]